MKTDVQIIQELEKLVADRYAESDAVFSKHADMSEAESEQQAEAQAKAYAAARNSRKVGSAFTENDKETAQIREQIRSYYKRTRIIPKG